MSDMTYRPLGPSGLMVSTVGLGTNAFGTRIDADQTQRVVDAALDAGITLFDTSDTYGVGASEELLGRALGARRDDVVVATKFGMDMGGANGPDWGARASRRYVRRAVEASLRRLGTDHIDLYQLHQPDLVTPIARDPRGADGAGHRGQGPLRRVQQLRGLGGSRRALDGGDRGTAPVRLRAERVLPLQPGRGGGADPGPGAPRPEPDRLLPAGLRPAGREVPPRRAGPDGQPARGRYPVPPAGERRLGPDRGSREVRVRPGRRHPRRCRRRTGGACPGWAA